LPFAIRVASVKRFARRALKIEERTVRLGAALAELLRKLVAVKNVVTKNERDTIVPYEVPPDDEGIRKTVRVVLRRKQEVEPDLRTVTQEASSQSFAELPIAKGVAKRERVLSDSEIAGFGRLPGTPLPPMAQSSAF
jgi:hypothetical protein